MRISHTLLQRNVGNECLDLRKSTHQHYHPEE
jgi:hypothetical protein